MRRWIAVGVLGCVLLLGVGCIPLWPLPRPTTTVPSTTTGSQPQSSTQPTTPAETTDDTAALVPKQPVTPAEPQAALHTPKPGSPERVAILNALRPKVEADLHQRVAFKCDVFRVESGWAFITGVPVQPDGSKIDYSKTKFESALKQGFFDNGFAALLHYAGGAWHVSKWEVGATDVAWEPWPDETGAPKSLF